MPKFRRCRVSVSVLAVWAAGLAAVAALAAGAALAGSALLSHTAALAAPPAPALAARSRPPRCPAQKPIVHSRRADTELTLVPAGAWSVLVCRYSGVSRLPGGTSGLIAARLVSHPRMIRQLTRAFDALPPMSGTFSCPVDNGSALVAFFRYRSDRRPGDVVSLSLSGCRTVTNGELARRAAAWSGSKLIGLLDRLTLGG